MSYLDDARSYLNLGRKEAPGILFCITVAVGSYILARGTVLDGGPRLLDPTLFSENPAFSALFKIGPIVLALLIGLLVNISPLNPGGAYAGRYLLRLAIVLMGARVTVDILSHASPIGIIIIL
ncbi:MAG TPA: hypothetical protein PKJ15_05210, partial [Methanomassiliicoccales archaeon]|nr:hypothetical protein [Methanomassiliicoccales archaeon]